MLVTRRLWEPVDPTSHSLKLSLTLELIKVGVGNSPRSEISGPNQSEFKCDVEDLGAWPWG